MTAIATTAPLPQYYDLEGAALNGSAYFGAPSSNPKTSPITMYWDSAMTQPASQPLSIKHGVVMRNGTPSPVFANSDYSLLLLDSKGRQVLYVPTAADLQSLRGDLVNNILDAKGAALVGFGGDRNYVAGTIGARLNEWISVKDFPWLAKADGTTDDWDAITAAIAFAASNQLDVHFPSGIYRCTKGIVVLNVWDMKLYGNGGNSSQICYDGVANSDTAVLALENCSYMEVDRIGLYGSLPGTASKAGFGFYITNSRTGPPSITQYNTCRKVRTGRYTDCGFQDGRRGTNTDVTTDNNGFIDCFADGSNFDFTAFANVGARFEDSNTNFAHWIGGAIAAHNVASIELAAYSRNIQIDGVLWFDAGPRPGTGPSSGSHILIRNNQSGPVSIKNITTELYRESFLVSEQTSAGTVNYNQLTLENINCTANYGIGGYAGTDIINYKGTGSPIMTNCRFGGSLSDTGVPSVVRFRPANAPQSGPQTLKIQGLHLYDGAWLDVETSNALAYFSLDAQGVVDGSPLFVGSISGNTLTVHKMIQGASLLAVNSVIAGARGVGGVTLMTKITALGTGTGAEGTYTVNNSQTVGRMNMVASSGADYAVFKVPDTTKREQHDCQYLPDITLAAGIQLERVGSQDRGTWKVTVPFWAFTANALNQTIYIATLPAATKVCVAKSKTTTAFAGTAGTLQLSMGVLADGDLLSAHDVKTAAINKGYASADLGAGLAAATQGGWTPSPTGAAQAYIKLVSSSGNLGNGTATNLTAGSVTLYLTTEVEP